jgi:hypothetical protein
MKKDYIFALLFFSGVWGISEAVLGGVLYRADIPYASVPLTVVGFVVLTFASVYFPQKGTGTLIASFAMLYKFLNAPFFACHLLGIVVMGASYDLFFNVLKLRTRWFSAVAATYLNYAAFAVMITYVFRYSHWVQEGLSKVVRHIGIGGSVAALACAVMVPLSYRLAEKLKADCATPFAVRLQLVPGSLWAITVAAWAFGIVGNLVTH